MGAVLDVYLIERGVDNYSAEGDPVAQFIWMGVYLAIGPAFVLSARRVNTVAKGGALLFALTAFALASAAWSTLPELTLRRSVALLATTLFGAYVASRYTIREQLRLLAWALGIAAVLSIVAALLVPRFGIDDDGLWRGVFAHKNSLGRVMALAAVAFYILGKGSRKARRLCWIFLGLSLCLLWFSRSGTAIVITAALFLSIPVVAWVQRNPQGRLWTALGFIALCGTLAFLSGVLDLSEFMKFLGKDETLTGRTFVWAYALDAITARPLIGYGYTAFWLSPEGQDIQATLGPAFVHAHNGYLDLALQLGLVGLLAFLATLARNLSRSLRTEVSEFDEIWPTVFFIFVLMYNMTESSILGRNNLFWILYVSMTLSLAQATRSRRIILPDDLAADRVNLPNRVHGAW